MTPTTLLGFLAAFCTSAALFPQIYKIYKTKHVRDLSFPMYVIFTTGIVLWLIYGIMIRSAPMIAANSVNVVSCTYIIAMMIKYK